MCLLTLLTLGVYPSFWFLRRREAINSLAARGKIGTGVFLFTTIGWCLSLLANAAFPGIGLESDFPVILQATVGLTLVLQSFKVAAILKEHYRGCIRAESLRQELCLFPRPAILLFGIFYLQYEINRCLKSIEVSAA